MPPLAASGSNSSDYFEPDDPEFLHALQMATLPGDIPPLAVPVVACGSDAVQDQLPRTSLKRSRSISDGQDIPQSTTHRHDSLSREDDTYGPSHFGQFGEYMRRKRAKLQIQNAELEEPVEAAVSGKIFRGLAIYVRFLVYSFINAIGVIYRKCLSDKWLDRAFRTGSTSTDYSPWWNLSSVSR